MYPTIAEADLRTLRRAATVLATQTGTGVPRAALVGLAGTATRALTVYAGDPVLAVVGPPAPGTAAVFATLTPREREVAALLAAGRSNREIAQALVLTIGTVKDHVHRILGKTGLRGRAAVAAAWRDGQTA